MAAKIAFIFVISFVFIQMVTWGVEGGLPRVARDAPEKNLSQQLDEVLNNLKTNFDDLSKKIQGNELFQNISSQLKTFGETVQKESNKLVEKIQSNTNKQ